MATEQVIKCLMVGLWHKIYKLLHSVHTSHSFMLGLNRLLSFYEMISCLLPTLFCTINYIQFKLIKCRYHPTSLIVSQHTAMAKEQSDCHLPVALSHTKWSSPSQKVHFKCSLIIFRCLSSLQAFYVNVGSPRNKKKKGKEKQTSWVTFSSAVHLGIHHW